MHSARGCEEDKDFLKRSQLLLSRNSLSERNEIYMEVPCEKSKQYAMESSEENEILLVAKQKVRVWGIEKAFTKEKSSGCPPTSRDGRRVKHSR